jgi:glycosyltransferase Alg8
MFPKNIYFLIPSYKEEDWVTVEVVKSLLDNILEIPSHTTLLFSTGSEKEDELIGQMYDSHPAKEQCDLIFQRQKDGKRIAMGHGLRSISRKISLSELEDNSITVFMDGDSYLEKGALKKTIPFFTAFKDLGALTTNEVAYINSKNLWYKDWFNLKFGQRNVLFQSHSLSHRVLTLTGRFSVFRTSIVIKEEFIKRIENDILVSDVHGKFRFLMGDDKTSWYEVLKNGWKMLYLPDIYCYSLESRDMDFITLSTSLPYRWYGNTMRNNKRALELKNVPFFIRWCIFDQKISMWTSLVGIVGAIYLSIFVHYIYFPIYVAWVIFVRIVQGAIIVGSGYPISLYSIPLMLYTQWAGAIIKIVSSYNLADQKWQKGTNVQNSSKDHIPIDHWYAKHYPKVALFFSFFLFLFIMLLLNIEFYIPFF